MPKSSRLTGLLLYVVPVLVIGLIAWKQSIIPAGLRDLRFRVTPASDALRKVDTVFVTKAKATTAPHTEAKIVESQFGVLDSISNEPEPISTDSAELLVTSENNRAGHMRQSVQVVNECATATDAFAVAYIDTLNRLITKGWFKLRPQRQVTIGDVAGGGLFVSEEVEPDLSIVTTKASSKAAVATQHGSPIELPVAPHRFLSRTPVLSELYTLDQAKMVDMRTTPSDHESRFTYVEGPLVRLNCSTNRPDPGSAIDVRTPHVERPERAMPAFYIAHTAESIRR